MKLIRGPFRYVRPYSKYVVLNIGFNLLGIIFGLFTLTLAIPFLGLLFGTQQLVHELPPFRFSAGWMQQFFAFRVTNIIESTGKEAALLWLCGMVVLMFLLKNFSRYLAMYFLAPVRNGVIMDIRNALYNKILVLPLSYYSNERKGDLMTRMTSDVQEIEWSVIGAIEMIFRDPPTVLVYLLTLFFMSPELTLFSLILIPVAGLLIGRIGRSLRRSSDAGMHKTGELMSLTEETLGGLRIIKAFNAEPLSRERFKDTNYSLKRLMNRIYRKKDLASPLSELLGALVIVAIMLFGGRAVLSGSGNLSPEIFMTFILVFSQILPPVKAISQAYYNLQKGKASMDRVERILQSENNIRNKETAIRIETFEHEIRYEHVYFSYGAEPVLKNIDFVLEKGKTIALVGQSGSGKSTLADLLPRFYDPDNGKVMIDGHDLRELRLENLRSLMGVVSQESILFNDTLFNNIALGKPDASIEEVIHAAKIANAHDFIMEMEEGYQTNIGDRGHKLSGGQRQRISIARAVLKNPPILILDEATSALDTESEKLVQDALSRLMAHRTSLIIAHRLSTIQHADQILVMQDGAIVECGTHQELLQHLGHYKKLFDLQSFS
jgi:ATP-binding cassette, subfamily B, bacterial MsbA